MKRTSRFLGMLLLCTLAVLSACAVTEQSQHNTSTPNSATSPPVESNPASSPSGVELRSESTLAATGGATATAAPNLPATEEEASGEILAPRIVTASTLLKGPLIAYRVQNGHNSLLLLDVGTWSLREVEQEDLSIGALHWLDKGCNLFTRGNVIDLNGIIVERTNDPTRGEALFQVQILSPDRRLGVVEVFSGSHKEVELDYITLEILNRDNLDSEVLLAPNGGAYSYAWSPTGNWLAFSDFDQEGILQVYRATPDGQIVEQLTSHSKDPGVLQLITWSPDGQNIAYAAQALLPGQADGWVGFISLPDLRVVAVEPSGFKYAKGLWWSKDSERVVIVGEGVRDTINGGLAAQVHWAERDSGTILNSFYEEEAPGRSFGIAVPVGSIDTVFFEAKDGYYLLDTTTNTYVKVLDSIPTDGLVREYATSPFDFPGEANCVKDSG